MLHCLPFNPFAENTYLLADADGAAVVIDPGMSTAAEEAAFDEFLRKHAYRLTACWLTHAHIDHVLGLSHVARVYDLQPHVHPGERIVYEANPQVAQMYGITLAPLPPALFDLAEGTNVACGQLELQVILAPGHSPASVCFYLPADGLLIGGDVLFRDSIGRTDLPGGNHEQLLQSIRDHIYTLPKETVVWPGHGPSTTVGYERVNNPFVQA